MNLQQLRYVRETVRQHLNLTEAAKALFTSQPGVSRQIRELEVELGVDIFERRGKRFVALTEPGKRIVAIAERVLQDLDNLKQVGRDFTDQAAGNLTLATTHTQARYALPKVVAAFRNRFPHVRLQLLQGNPTAIAQMVIRGEADIGIATEALDHFTELAALPGYRWHHVVVVPPGHALLERNPLSLQDLAQYPIITYSPEFTGRSHINEAFAARGLAIEVVLTAIDSDVIKTYVELGLGIGIIAAMAFDAERDRNLRALDAAHLFRSSITRIAVRRGTYLRGFAYSFIEAFAPQLRRPIVEQAMTGPIRAADPDDYQL